MRSGTLLPWFQSSQPVERCSHQQLFSKGQFWGVNQHGKTHSMPCEWYQSKFIPWLTQFWHRLHVSQKGYMTGEIGREWIEHDFDPPTRLPKVALSSLLLMGTHPTSPKSFWSMQRIMIFMFSASLHTQHTHYKVSSMQIHHLCSLQTSNSLRCCRVFPIQALLW